MNKLVQFLGVKRFAATLIVLAATTNLPARAQSFSSTYPQINVAGDFNGFETLNQNMTLIGNNTWQGDFTISSSSFRFKFAAPNFQPSWGLAPPTNSLPMIYKASSTGPDIVVTNPPIISIETNGSIVTTNRIYLPIRFIFDDSNAEFSIFLLNNTRVSNLLFNGSFDIAGTSSTRAQYWQAGTPNNLGNMIGNGRRMISNTLVSGRSGPGMAAIRGKGVGLADNFGIWWQEVPAEAGVRYQADGFFIFNDTSNTWAGSTRQFRLEFLDFNRSNTLATYTTDLSDLNRITNNLSTTNNVRVVIPTNWQPRSVSGSAPAGSTWARVVFHAENYGVDGSLRLDDVSLFASTTKRSEDFNTWPTGIVDGRYNRNGWVVDGGKIVSSYSFGGVTIPLARSGNAARLANTAGGTNLGGYVQSIRYDDGVGEISFYYRHGSEGNPSDTVNPADSVSLKVEVSLTADINSWVTVAELTNIVNKTFQPFYSFQEIRSPRFIRIVHSGGSANALIIDDVSVGSPVSQSRVMDFERWTNASATVVGTHDVNGLGWRITNGLVSGSIAIGFRAGHLTGPATGRTNYLESPNYSDGHGAISFKYRRGVDSARTLAFAIQSSTNNGANWTNLVTVTNVASLGWVNYSRFFFEPTPRKIRIANIPENNTAVNANIIIEEPFNNGSSAPSGWIFTSMDKYDSTASSGFSPPSLKFDITGSQIITPAFTGPTNIRFFTRGNSITPASSLAIEGLVSSNWIVITNLGNFSNSRVTNSINVATNITQLRFTYNEDEGNLAFDDLRITGLQVGSTNLTQTLILDDVVIARPEEFRIQTFDAWPARSASDLNNREYQSWTLDGFVAVGNTKAYSGQSAQLNRTAELDTEEFLINVEGAGETTSGSGYGPFTNVSLSGSSWYFDSTRIATLGAEADWALGTRSIRLRGYSNSVMRMNSDRTDGLSALSFQHRRYGTDAQVTWRVDASTNSGATWFPIGNTFQAGSTVQTYTAVANITGRYRLRIIHHSGGTTSNRRINIDDIIMTSAPISSGGAIIDPIITSHYLRDGIGSVTFQYRHADDNPTNALTLIAQSSSNGINWVNTSESPLLVSNATYKAGSFFIQQPAHYYARVIITNGTGSILVDRIEVRRPEAPATLSLFGFISPENPFTNQAVNLQASVSPTFGVVNVNVTSYYRVGTSGAFIAIAMTGSGNNFAAVSNIPPQPSGTIVQYYMRAWFEGPGASLTSPVTYPAGGTNNPAFYAIPRQTPRQVWINEVDYNNGGLGFFSTNPARSFIELAGISGSDITDWRVDIYAANRPNNPYGSYVLNNYTILSNDINGIGFYLLAQAAMTNSFVHTTLTNLLSTSSNLPSIVILYNELGGIEDALAYGGHMPGYDYLPIELNNSTQSISLIGTGALGDQFGWSPVLVLPTPGAVNSNQTIASPGFISAPSALEFSYIAGSISPPDQLISIVNTGVSSIAYNISALPSWITITPLSVTNLPGGSSIVHTVAIDTTGFSGDYSGSLTIQGNAVNTPYVIPVQVRRIILNNALVFYDFNSINIPVDNLGALGSSGDLFITNGADLSLSGQGASGEIGDRAYVTLPGSAAARAFSSAAVTGLNQRASFTMTGWLRPTGSSGAHRLFGNRVSTNGFALMTTTNYGNLMLVLGTNSITSTNLAIQPSAWTFFAVTVDGTNSGFDAVKYYTGSTLTNTALISNHSRAGAPGTGTSTNQFMLGGDGIAAFNGLIDDVRIYDGAIDLMSIESIRRSGAVRGTGVGFAPFIVEHPVSVVVNAPGNIAEFNFDESSSPNALYQWRKNGTNIPGATAGTLSFLDSAYDDYGNYDVVVQNAYGTVTSQTAELIFKINFITQSPTNIFLYPGDTLNIDMQVTQGSNTYRWVSNSVVMAGFNTNRLSMANFSNTNMPSFYLIASNKTGVITSKTVVAHVIDLVIDADNGAQGIVKPSNATNVVLSWPSVTNRFYDILWSTNLMSGQTNFVIIATNRIGTPPFNVWTDSVYGAQGVGFYRIRAKEGP